MGTMSLRAVGPAVGAIAVATGLLAGAAPALADPPGDNGTVKVDGVEFDVHPDNQPHVGCTFQVDFYGFDEGDLDATVTFEAKPPTGTEVLLEDDEVSIGEDAAGGGTDLDAERTYDLTGALAAVEPHPQQGWHVKLTVHAEGSIGADTKYKTFWVSGCGSSGSTTTTTKPGSSTTTIPGSSTTVPGSSTTTVGITPGASIVPPPPGDPSDPPPAGPSTPDEVTPAATGDLPETGSDSLPLAAVALGLVGVGAAVLVASRATARGR